MIKITFKDSFNVEEVSAETIAQMFSQFGDFHVYKDTRKSILLCFYYIHGQSLPEASPKGFIEMMRKPELREQYHVEDCSALDEAKKFVAFNHFE